MASKVLSCFLMIVAVQQDILSLFDLFRVKKLYKSKEICKSLNINVCKQESKSFGSDTEHSDVESVESRSHICETELGEDKTDIYHSDPEGPYMDKPLADEDW